MQKLEKSGIRFEYDSEKLKAAGIRLDGVIDMNVEKVNANGFFRAMCEPLGLDFDIDGVTVRLRPAEK